jgi:hypothetical protein
MLDFAAGGHVAVTPRGAYLATLDSGGDALGRLLAGLLAETDLIGVDALADWLGTHGHAAESLLRAQKFALIEAVEQPRSVPEGALEVLAPTLIRELSSTGKTVLADPQGFYLATSGYPHEAAEELAGLSASLAAMDQRHRRLLSGNLGIESSAWGVLDAVGGCQLGFAPLNIGANRFVLVCGGRPTLNKFAFADLVWLLMTRYSVRAGEPKNSPSVGEPAC